MPKFSIIVPVYNSEKTIRRCLDSIEEQTINDFEVLLVDNASCDSSNSICCEYVDKDIRFKLFTREKNEGPSGARNVGLENSSGTYITFLDSDDHLESDYLANLDEAFADNEVVFFGYHQVALDGQFICDHLPDVNETLNYYNKLIQLYKQDMFGYTWIKAFRKDTIGKNRFPTDLNLLEDEVFACNVLSKKRKIGVLPKAIINYVTGNNQSLIGKTHQDYCKKVDAAYKAWKELLNSCDNKKEILTEMANSHVSRCMYYGFEREVNVKDFFAIMKNCEFFADSNINNAFTLSVKDGNYRKISLNRKLYRIKIKIANLLKGKK